MSKLSGKRDYTINLDPKVPIRAVKLASDYDKKMFEVYGVINSIRFDDSEGNIIDFFDHSVIHEGYSSDDWYDKKPSKLEIELEED